MTLPAHDQNLGIADETVALLTEWARKNGCSFERALCQAVALGLECLEARTEEQRDMMPGGRDAGLPPRQRQVLGLLMLGCSVKEIAGEMGVSVATVRTHVRRLKEKTGCAGILSLCASENTRIYPL